MAGRVTESLERALPEGIRITAMWVDVVADQLAGICMQCAAHLTGEEVATGRPNISSPASGEKRGADGLTCCFISPFSLSDCNMANTKNSFSLFVPLIISIAIITTFSTQTDSSTQYNIVIVAGQSNAVGRAPVLPEWRIDSTGISQLGRFGDTNLVVIPAIAPLAHWDASGSGFALKAVSLLRGVEGGDFLIIPAAMGASGFIDNMWTAHKGPLYVDLVQRAKAALAGYPGSTIRAVLWHQGETEWEEAPSGFNDKFPEEMAEMVQALRADLPIDGAPFVMGGLVPEWAERQSPNPNAVLADIAQAVGACFVSSEGGLPLQDGIHFELGSQMMLGARYFDAMQSCLKR